MTIAIIIGLVIVVAFTLWLGNKWGQAAEDWKDG